jgi:hypothetical protein
MLLVTKFTRRFSNFSSYTSEIILESKLFIRASEIRRLKFWYRIAAAMASTNRTDIKIIRRMDRFLFGAGAFVSIDRVRMQYDGSLKFVVYNLTRFRLVQ